VVPCGSLWIEADLAKDLAKTGRAGWFSSNLIPP